MNIKELPSHLKPREKLQKRGAHSLSDKELICIILGSGIRSAPVTLLADKIYSLFSKSTPVTLQNLMTIRGIGLAKATQLLAIYELQKRMATWNSESLPLTTAKQVFSQYKHLFLNTAKEELHVVLLNTQLEPITDEMIFRGTLDSITLHAREIFYSAISHSAHSLIVIHNHPSQSAQPSKADIIFTEQLVQIGEIIGIPVVDHMIFTKRDFWSYVESLKT